MRSLCMLNITAAAGVNIHVVLGKYISNPYRAYLRTLNLGKEYSQGCCTALSSK